MTWNQFTAPAYPNGMRTIYPRVEIPLSPPEGTIVKVTPTPQRLVVDWTTLFVGAIAGAFITLLFVYGVAPAAFQYGAAKIRQKT